MIRASVRPVRKGSPVLTQNRKEEYGIVKNFGKELEKLYFQINHFLRKNHHES